MIYLPVRIDVNPSAIKTKLEGLFGSNLAKLCSEILKDCNKYCKDDKDTLMESSYEHSELEKGLLIWQTPYAARQYYEIQTAYRDKNPNASWRWCDVAKQHHLGHWEETAQKLAKGGSNG